jgi:Xaa-Pro aminopeptidase
MKRRGLSALLVTDRSDQNYLTGFTGEDGGILITSKKVFLLTDGRFETSSQQEASWATAIFRKGSLAEVAGTLATQHRLKKVGFQAEFVTVELLAGLRKAGREVQWKATKGLVLGQRICKDTGEIKRIEAAVHIAEGAFRAVRKTIRPGQTERQVAGRLEYEMQRRGASGSSFPSIVAEGPNGALPHAHPGQRKIRRGSAILIDWGAYADFYCSDLTRMVYLKTVPRRIEKIHQIVLDAQQKAIAAIGPGVLMCEVDAVARGIISEAGHGDRFGHGLGHGIGLDIHEAPRLNQTTKDPLEPGMVVTVEPGIYLPGVGGVRIEDDVLVTKTGRRVLSRLGKSVAESVI